MVTTATAGRKAVVWFRKGLRLHDNPALLAALAAAPGRVQPVFLVDDAAALPHGGRMAPHRARFLVETLADLDASLRARGSQLYCLRGASPAEALGRACRAWGVTDLYYEFDSEPHALRRDAAVCRAAREELGVEPHAFQSHTLYDLDSLMARSQDQVPTTYTAFLKLVAKAGPPPQARMDVPAALPPPFEGDAAAAGYGLPTLEGLGYAAAEVAALPEPLFPGGETEALRRLNAWLEDEHMVAMFEKPQSSPAEYRGRSTTVLSPYLANGSLSPRHFFHRLQPIYAKFKGHAKPPVSLEGQLYWREFFTLNGYAIKNFDRMEGNRICRQIPWTGGAEGARLLELWEHSRTGFPWIDAIMAQLRQEGWIHHLARHSVACFLTRGDLWVSWEQGRDVFEKYLLDADWSLNSANWMWLSCSSYFYQYFRCYSPAAFPKKYANHKAYIRHYVPALKKFPDKYLLEPWTAPLSVQKGCGCIIGQDYPAPVVDHKAASKANMGKMKAAYDAMKAKAGGGGGGGGGAAKPKPKKKAAAKKAAGPAAKKQKTLKFA